MNKKLFIFGCSYSDRTGVKKAYGDYLAETTGLEYRHCAKGGTSNDRIWRMATRMVIDGEITANDIVIVQYTDRHRREFASYGISYDEHLDTIRNNIAEQDISNTNMVGVHPMDRTTTECGTFYTSNYKMDSHSWQVNQFDRDAHFFYEKATALAEFDHEYFKTRHQQFEAFCEIHNIKLVIYWCRLSDTLVDHNPLGPYARKYLINEENFIPREIPHCYKYELGIMNENDVGNWDNSHLSVLGHRAVAQKLAEHLKRHSLI